MRYRDPSEKGKRKNKGFVEEWSQNYRWYDVSYPIIRDTCNKLKKSYSEMKLEAPLV